MQRATDLHRLYFTYMCPDTTYILSGIYMPRISAAESSAPGQQLHATLPKPAAEAAHALHCGPSSWFWPLPKICLPVEGAPGMACGALPHAAGCLGLRCSLLGLALLLLLLLHMLVPSAQNAHINDLLLLLQVLVRSAHMHIDDQILTGAAQQVAGCAAVFLALRSSFCCFCTCLCGQLTCTCTTCCCFCKWVGGQPACMTRTRQKHCSKLLCCSLLGLALFLVLLLQVLVRSAHTHMRMHMHMHMHIT